MCVFKESWYSHQWRKDVLQSAVTGFVRIWELEVAGKGFVNRPNHVTATKRRASKLIGKSNWFKVNKAQKEGQNQRPRSTVLKRGRKGIKSNQIPPKYESILFCPYTPFSKLKRLLQSTEDKINGKRATCRVKVVERAGPTMGDLLYNKTPWSKEHCSRQDCLPCQTKPGGCKSPNVTYRLKCNECQKNGI